MSSPKALAKSVLENLASIYIDMRNRLSLHGRKASPIEHMTIPISEDQRNLEQQRLRDYKKSKAAGEEDQLKLDRLHWVIRHYGLDVDSKALKRAERTIKAYELEAIGETETAFLKATNRKAERKNLHYFFGILKNIQQKRDDDAKKEYCRERYNYNNMLNLQGQKDNKQDPISINDIIGMLVKAVTITVRNVKALAIRKAQEWTHELMESYRYIGSLKKNLSDALGKLQHLSMEQKRQAWELIEQFLNPKISEKCVTLSS